MRYSEAAVLFTVAISGLVLFMTKLRKKAVSMPMMLNPTALSWKLSKVNFF